MSLFTDNVDPAEIAKFDTLASRWWDPDGELKTLHDINPLRVGWVQHRTGGLDGARVVDVGCGGGLLAEAMAARGATVKGIDLSHANINVARLHSLESGIGVDYEEKSAEVLAAETPGEWDVVTCMELLEHVPEPASLVHACATLLKPGGHAFFSTLNRNPKSWLMAVVGAEYVLGLLPRGTHDYARFIRPAELARWCRAAGLEPAATTGIGYNPFTQRYHLVESVDVNYLMHLRRA